MKMKIGLLVTMTFLTLNSCDFINVKKNKPNNDDSINSKTNNTLGKKAADSSKINQELYTVQLNKAVQDAMQVSRQHFKDLSFEKKYEFQEKDDFTAITVEIKIGQLFNKGQQILILKLGSSFDFKTILYTVIDNEPIQMIECVQEGSSYIGDTIMDVNGDGHKDYLIHSYPSSGCCRRDVYDVYLYSPNQNKFSASFEFVNPTFSAKEKIIRGVEYGQPGEAGLYKFKWNGWQVDTLEYIYNCHNKKGLYIKTKTDCHLPTEKDGKVLTQVPKEYLHIESYDWFSEF